MILVIGQNTAWQKCCAIPSFAHGEVNRFSRVLAFPSSKGPNVGRALKSVGAEVLVLGYAGGATGRMFAEGMRAEGIPGLWTTIRDETRACTTIAEASGVCTECIEPAPVVQADEREAFRRAFLDRIGRASVLVIAGTAVGGEAEDCYRWFAAEAHGRGAVVLMDSNCREARRALEAGPDVLKINMRELAEFAGHPVEDPADRARAYRALHAEHGIRWILVSRGPDGIEGSDGVRLLHASPPPIAVVNAIGSGDAATAGAAWIVHERLKTARPADSLGDPACFAEALRTAAAMGTANCLNPINGMVRRADYERVRAEVLVREVGTL